MALTTLYNSGTGSVQNNVDDVVLDAGLYALVVAGDMLYAGSTDVAALGGLRYQILSKDGSNSVTVYPAYQGSTSATARILIEKSAVDRHDVSVAMDTLLSLLSGYEDLITASGADRAVTLNKATATDSADVLYQTAGADLFKHGLLATNEWKLQGYSSSVWNDLMRTSSLQVEFPNAAGVEITYDLTARRLYTATAIAIGASGADYAGIGYNVTFQTASDSHKYIGSDGAAYLQFQSGGLRFRTAGAGTAGATIAWTDWFEIANTGATTFRATTTVAHASATFTIDADTGTNPNLYWKINSATKFRAYVGGSDTLAFIDADASHGVGLAQNSNAWASASDGRLKPDWAPINISARLRENPDLDFAGSFHWSTNGQYDEGGRAQDYHRIFPALVEVGDNGTDDVPDLTMIDPRAWRIKQSQAGYAYALQLGKELRSDVDRILDHLGLPLAA